MSTYRALKGYSVKSLTSDPANPNEGQVWYNSTAKTIKIQPLIKAWASGGNLGTARSKLAAGGSSTQTAGLVFGGNSGSATADTEEYNGSAWAEQNNMANARQLLAGLGTQAAALAFQGDGTTTTSEEYGGTSWTAGGTLNTGRGRSQACGTQTAGLAFGGEPNDNKAATEHYDGSSWTNGGNLNAGRQLGSGAGTQTAGLIFGGDANPGI
jgi:hypothetical protein